MKTIGWRWTLRGSVTASLLVAALAMLTLTGCSGGGDDDNDSDNVAANPPADDGSNGGSTPDEPALLEVHEFEYDEATEEYVVLGERISQDRVERDLAGSLCSKCHTKAVAELKDSVHY